MDAKGIKKYDIKIKYIEVIMGDMDVLVYEAYSPIPKDHRITDTLIKLSFKDALIKINKAEDEDGLLMDYSGAIAYLPSDIKKVRWSEKEDTSPSAALMDITTYAVGFKPGDKISIGGFDYSVVKVIDWTKNKALGTKFAYCNKIGETRKPVEVVVEDDVVDKKKAGTKEVE